MKCVLFLVFVFEQGWCVLEACYTTLVCRLADGPAVPCLVQRRVTLTTVLRGVAVLAAATMTMCASAVCNCKTLTPFTVYHPNNCHPLLFGRNTHTTQRASSLVNVIKTMSRVSPQVSVSLLFHGWCVTARGGDLQRLWPLVSHSWPVKTHFGCPYIHCLLLLRKQ